MSRASLILVIIVLAAALVAVASVPAIGEWLRDSTVSLFGEKGSRYFGVVLNIITVGVLLWQGGSRILRWARSRRESRAPRVVTGEAENSGQMDGRKQAAQRVRADTNQVAQRVSDFAAEFDRRSPYKLRPGEEPNLDFDSPEYQAELREKGAQYDVLVDELRERYRVELLPEVIRVRGALADQGITDTQLDEIYRKPKNDKGVATIAELLWDMAGRLERRP